MYKVYYLNVFLRSFATRDEALEYRMRHANRMLHALDDYEIVDGDN